MTPASPTTGTAARAFAWVGGVLFVAALACGAYFFLIVLGRPPVEAGGLAPAVVNNTALFLLFAGHHSVMARTRAKGWLLRHVPADLERAVYVWMASALFILLCAAWRPVPGEAWRFEGAWAWMARTVQVAGLVLTALAVRLLDAFDIAGIRHVHSAPSAPPQPMSTAGAYGLVRHPIYLGWILMVAAADMTAGRLLFAVLSIGYLVVAVPWEERDLEREFGDAYRAYKARVRWRMVPGLY